MFANPSSLRIAVYGSEVKLKGRGVGLWSAGYQGCITAAGATPILIGPASGDESWDEVLAGCSGVAVCGHGRDVTKMGDAESLCNWARQRRFPLLVIDQGLLAMNLAFGGTIYQDLARDLPEALQHRHPPEPGLRHAINVEPNTQLAAIYGEGEIVVNSEHRQGIERLAKGFRVTGTALDGVIEAIESTNENWWVMGVQWQPAATSASGLDIQVFRALITAATAYAEKVLSRTRAMAAAG
jgi:putative glutamine amidotransferase